MAKVSPRFWCRNLCPSGALMALLSRKPLIRRDVSDDCTDCGRCANSCPMSAIMPEDPRVTLHEECIVCRTCENTCPVQNQPAIVVTPMGALRMSEGSYVAQGKSQGLNLSITPKSEYGLQPRIKDWGKGFAPGFEDDESGGD